MDKKQAIIVAVLISIPVLFCLFILAIMNVLYLLLGIIVLLCAALVLKQKFMPDFGWKKPAEVPANLPSTDRGSDRQKVQVYMVLSGQEDFGARRIAVNRTSYTIGRSTDNDYVIDGGQISRHHVKIEYNPIENICYAIDTSSANGTYLNSVRMTEGQRYPLKQGDCLMIDDRSFIVEYARY